MRLVVETGDAREVHHMALLIGYGAGAVNPYLAFETVDDMIREGSLPGLTHARAVANYIQALNKGILKVMSKMGISTLQSYKGAQIFEAVGLKDEVIDHCFAGTASRIQGVDFDVLAEESLRRHALGYPEKATVAALLPNPGEFHWRAEGERHMWDPAAIADVAHRLPLDVQRQRICWRRRGQHFARARRFSSRPYAANADGERSALRDSREREQQSDSGIHMASPMGSVIKVHSNGSAWQWLYPSQTS